MQSRGIHWPRLLALVLIGYAGLWPGRVAAVEQAGEFLDGLRQRGMYDTAMAYLDQMRTSPRCPSTFREILDYEAGVTLLAGARTVKTPTEHQGQLDRATDFFQKFLKEHPRHALAAGASIQLANVLLERGRASAEQSVRETISPEQRTTLLNEARQRYDEAGKLLAAVDEQLVEELKKLPQGALDKTQAALSEQREQLRGDLVQTRLLLCDVGYQTAKTYDLKSEEGAAGMIKAAKQYNSLYEKYGSRLGGLVARMGEGRCYKDLGDKSRATLMFGELLAQPDEPEALRNLKNQALVLDLETCLSAEANVEDYKRAAAEADDWEKSARREEQWSKDGLTIQLLRAEAHLGLAGLLKVSDPQRSRSLTAARKGLLFLARSGGDRAWEAQSLLKDPLLRGPEAPAEASTKEPMTFAEASERAKAELGKLVDAETSREMDLNEGKKEKLSQYARQIADAQAAAARYCRMALAMRTPETPVDQLNTVRYHQSYLDWLAEDLYEAAVLGEFLAYRYPTSPVAKQGAKIAMAAYAKLYNQAKGAEDRQFAARRLFATAEYVTRRWPESLEAQDAWVTLIRTSVAGGKLDKARECLSRVPADWPGRAAAEFVLGQALWAAWVKADRALEGKPSPKEQDELLKEVRELLEQGVGRMQKLVQREAYVDATLLAGVLSLVQVDLSTGRAGEAVRLLEDPTFGPLALLGADPSTANQPEYTLAVYKAALRAYVVTQQLEKAEAAMNALEKLVAQSRSEDADKSLTLIYIGLGHELQKQLDELLKKREFDQAKKVSRGFERFLTRVAQRREGNTFQSLNWVAETFMGLGAGMDPGGNALSGEAREYYKKAAAAYREILARIQSDPGFAPQADAAVAIKIRLAKCLRRLGQSREAMTLLVDVLRTRGTLIDAQLQAAYTYAALGRENPEYYRMAIRGGEKVDTKGGSAYLVWGWGKISKAVSQNAQYAEIFHEARYNLALSRYHLAMTQSEEEQAETLKQAQTDIELVEHLYPQMGGDLWRAKYDALLKEIQKARDLEPTGLEAGVQNAEGSMQNEK